MITAKVRINTGSTVHTDFHSFIWPDPITPNPNMLFDAKYDGIRDEWYCSTPDNLHGVVVPGRDNVTVLEEIPEKIIHIGDLGFFPVKVLRDANTIKHLNYKVVNPTDEQFVKSSMTDHALRHEISRRIGVKYNLLNIVYFSCSQGAEEHIDKLDPAEFTSETYVIPVILPHGKSVITAENEMMEVQIGGIYKFNHEERHSMIVEDKQSGAVVIMVGVKRENH